MPKELTHFTVSDLALERIERDFPESGRLLRNNYEHFMLGSIIPDTAYYHMPFLDKGEKVSFLSDKIHTKGGCLESAFLRRVMEMAMTGDDKAFAFSCGIVSHHLADAAFHPFVVYHTGSFTDPLVARRKSAQARHRFLEGLIDLKIVSEQSRQVATVSRRMAGLLKKMPSPRLCLSLFIEAVLPQEGEECIKSLTKHLETARFFQLRLLGLYGRAYFKALILLVNRLSGCRYDHYAGLLYADRSYLALKLLNERVEFKGPFTGEGLKQSLSSLLDETADQVAGALSRYGEWRDRREKCPPDFFTAILPGPGGGAAGGRPEPWEAIFDVSEMEEALKRFTGRKG